MIPLFLILLLLSFQIKSLFFRQLKVKEKEGRINFVILGISGGMITPADLTDVIIYVSYNRNSGGTVAFSIPRDLWVPSIKAKINTAYHYGGFNLTRQTIEEVLGEPVHYFFVWDFEGFKKAVDFLGGVDVKVENSFDDYQYPIAGKENDECDGDKEYRCRYEHLRFSAGTELMTGERALKFVRSRNAEGEEGTDLARNARQQRFLTAFKNAVLSRKVIFNPEKLMGLARIFSASVKTDLSQEEYLGFFWALKKIQSNRFENLVLAPSKEDVGLLYHPQVHSSGQWVLATKSGKWDELQIFVKENLPD